MKITILMPTRNRVHLLPKAVEAALAQTDGNFELFISDNCSSDGTAEFIAGLKDGRVRSVRTDRPLSMPDHWNFAYDQALEKTTGDFILLCSDDDALTPDAIETILRAVKANPWGRLFQIRAEIYYYDDDINENKNMIKFQFPRPEGVERINGRAHVRSMLSTFAANFPGPGMVKRELLKEVKARYGKIFHQWAPDYSSGVLLMLLAGEFGRISPPVLLWGKGRASYGSGSQANPDHLLEFMRQFPEFDGRLDMTPYPDLITVNNMVVDTMLRTSRMLGAEGAWMRINDMAYRRHLREDIRIYQSYGHHRFDSFVAQVAGDRSRTRVSDWVDLQMAKMPKRVARWKRAFWPSNIVARLQGRGPKTVKIRGSEAGFSDIASAAKYYVQASRDKSIWPRR